MKDLYKIALSALAIMAMINTAKSQDALTINNTNFHESCFNTAYIAEKEEPLAASLTNTTGGGIQNTGQINFLAYSQLSKAGLSMGTRVNSKYFGLFRTSTVEIIAAKKIAINSSSALSAGFGMGMQFTSIRTGELNNYVDLQDPMLANDAFPQYRFVFGFGLGYTWRNKFKAGISMPSLARTESKFYPIYIANSSYLIQVSDDFGVEPQLLLFGSDIAPISAEVNAKVDYRKQFWIKLGGRSTSTFVGGIGVDTPFISVGYAYNAYFQEFKGIVPATHNINLAFRIAADGEGKGRKFQLF